MKYDEIIKFIKASHNQRNVDGMARYGINPENNYGVSVGKMRELAKEIGRDHELALKLWNSGIHDARILAPIIMEPDKITEEQMDAWVHDFDSWDICDGCCGEFAFTPFAHEKARQWCGSDEVFVKRAGFVMIARLAVRDKKADDDVFPGYLPLIEKGASDERNMVKKAVNWALRQIGKRNLALNKKAIKLAEKIEKIDSKSARWIARDALRELKSGKVQERLAGKK